MSLKDLQKKSASALDVMPAPTETTQQRRPITAPGATAMMQPTIDALNERAKTAERKAADLEARIKDLESTSLPVDAIGPNPWQPRRVFDGAAIDKLANSIAEVGLLQPIVVRRVQPLDTNQGSNSVQPLDTQYQIIVGERRYRAHKLLGHSEIKAIVVDAKDDDMAIWALTENIDREDLEDYEVGLALRQAEKEFPSRKRMAEALGIQRSDLYRYLDFFKLPDFIQFDLNVTPSLMSRKTASDLQALITAHGDKAIKAVSNGWTGVKSGTVNQAKLAELVEAVVLRGEHTPTDRDIRKLFVGKEQAGSITRDAKKLQVIIKATSLTPEMETKIRDFVEGVLKQEQIKN